MSTNTYLIECSHESAIVKSPDTNSFFSNRVADGIQMNPGDRVSVHSAYIHEIGSGSETIEFNGESVNSQSVLHTTSRASTLPQTQQATVAVQANSASTHVNVALGAEEPPVWYGSTVYTQDSVGAGPNSIEKSDNVTVTDTTRTGDGGRWLEALTLSAGVNKDLAAGTTIYVVNGWLSASPSLYTGTVTTGFSYPMTDNLVNISYGYYKNADGLNCMVLPRLYFSKQPFPNDAFSRYKFLGHATDDGVPPNFLDFALAPQDSAAYLPLYRRKHDSARYKVFVMADQVPAMTARHTPVGTVLALANILQLDAGRDVALRDYVQYRDKLQLSVPTGYNTPSNIADDLTSQMHSAPELVTKSANVSNKDGSSSQVFDLSVVVPSPTFKQFGCACVKTYNETTYDANVGLDIANNASFYNCHDYLAAQRFIGIHDPELFEAGRQLAREGYVLRKSIAAASRATAEIVISMEYTEANLLLWKAVFDAQARRQDLIFGTGVSTSNCRWIHLNPFNMIQELPTKFLYSRLGDDGVLPNPDISAAGSPLKDMSGQSARQFVNYGYGSSAFLPAGDPHLTDSNLSYGFAKATAVNEVDYYDAGGARQTKTVQYITFLTDQVGGIQSEVSLPVTTTYLPPTSGGSDGSSYLTNLTNFHTNEAAIGFAGGLYPANSVRFCGWDWHFSAYGNDAVVLWSGYVADGPVRDFPVPPADNTSNNTHSDYLNIMTDRFLPDGGVYQTLTDDHIFVTYAYVDWITLGADNPLINFSTTGSRFTISGLHTTPRQGNLPLAGRDSINNPQQSFADDPDSHNLVYRINPILNRGNTRSGFFSYNPEVRQLDPFDNSDTNRMNKPTTSLLKKWTIFDSQTGIFIEDFGCDEASWSKSLWYKLGFDYSQLNGSTLDYQGRATNSNQSHFPITTNADVNATQALALMVNAYDGSQYTLQSPIAGISITEILTTGTKYSQQLVPVMTEVQTSTALTAARKPEKQIYGYYTVRSSLIDNSQFFSENVMLPVISVLSKNYTGTDFVFSDESSDQFMVTKPTMITDITTGIYMPNGKLARTDPRSCIIYKIQKAFNYNPNIAQEIMSKKKS